MPRLYPFGLRDPSGSPRSYGTGTWDAGVLRADYDLIHEVLLGDRLAAELLVNENRADNTQDEIVPTSLRVDLAALLNAGSSSEALVLSSGQASGPWLFDPASDQWYRQSEDDKSDAIVATDPNFPTVYTPFYLFSFSGVDGAGNQVFEGDVARTALLDGRVLCSKYGPAFRGPVRDEDVEEKKKVVEDLRRRLAPDGGPDLRRVGYYTGHFDTGAGTGFALSDQLDDRYHAGSRYAASEVPPEDAVPMAFFAWDRDTGLENGNYDVYVVLDDSGLDRLRAMYLREKAIIESPNPPSWFVPILYTDPSGDPGLLTGWGRAFLEALPADYNAGALVRFYTDPTSVRRHDRINADFWPQSLPPEAGELSERELHVGAGAEGAAYYGTVRVTDNFLGMRIRNWARNSEDDATRFRGISRFSRVVLVPRPTAYGRININTARTYRVGDKAASRELFNPLLGLPGILAEYDPVRQLLVGMDGSHPGAPAMQGADNAAGDMGLVKWERKRDDTDENKYTDDYNPAEPKPHDDRLILHDWREVFTREEFRQARYWNIYDRAQWIARKRPEWPDGRYYRHPAELLGYVPFYDALDDARGRENQGLRPVLHPTDEDFHWKADSLDLLADGRLDPSHAPGDLYGRRDDMNLFTRPLIPDYRDKQFESLYEESLYEYEWGRLCFNEEVYRYSRLVNLVTTRSDVFEILVTAQTGYGVDANRDGRINYRDSAEFQVTGEKKLRTLYGR
ncbi:MAG TPA: hypothetical protein ENN80_07695 [Candidatus Hydrogenedentes bacterium]|nr:hypothetical protein [Candidatus Hydrogenedentota bacterium]